MLTRIASIGAPRALGICFDGTQAYGSLVTSTPLGMIECAQHSVSVDPENPAEGMRALMVRFGLRHEQLPVAIGLPVERTFFTTRPIHAGGGDATPRVLLREALRSSRVPVDEMLVDVVTSQPDNRTVASIVSCDRALVEKLTEPLADLNLRLERAEPAPCALLRMAIQRDRTYRRAKVVCRIFLSETELLAVLTARNQPILWRRARLPRGDEAAAILAAVRSLATTAEQSGVETRPEVVVVHGRMDLLRLIDTDWVRLELGALFEWHATPPLCPSLIARGLAEGCFSEQRQVLDLARALKAQPSLREVFPWREAVSHCVVLIAMLAFLAYQLSLVQDQYTQVSMRNAQSALSSSSRQVLENERRDLTQRVSAVKRFVDTRVLWTNHHRALAAALPDNIFVTSIHGDGELARRKGQKAKQQLIIQGAVSIPQDGLIPQEIDRLLDTLRTHPTLTAEFPVIELAELKQFKRPQHNDTLAMFTVVCIPESAKKTR